MAFKSGAFKRGAFLQALITRTGSANIDQAAHILSAVGNVQMSPKVRFYSLSGVYDFSAAFNIILKRSN
jgi:hypothetical protein